MFMSEFEIISSYRQAKCKSQQVIILSEMNLCEPSDIIELLKLNGVYHPKGGNACQRWTAAECNRIEAMLDANMTTKEIAAFYGCKPSVMSSTVTYLRSQGRLSRRPGLQRGRRPASLQTA